jgi:hypothetical protein
VPCDCNSAIVNGGARASERLATCELVAAGRVVG